MLHVKLSQPQLRYVQAPWVPGLTVPLTPIVAHTFEKLPHIFLSLNLVR